MKYIGIDVIIEFCLKYGYIIVLKERVSVFIFFFFLIEIFF